ncbi:hypothetical protein DPEC_G00283540 [Dallia pectoralis]|uniref:Uncharacterized protein n=1 Tax=Dallia pectoralis TaxID=75939 RepID=A0ACC2FJ46_DALPE|nr:hypothetical protein DPEC_G00283540 [Dallia pectoralis]
MSSGLLPLDRLGVKQPIVCHVSRSDSADGGDIITNEQKRHPGVEGQKTKDLFLCPGVSWPSELNEDESQMAYYSLIMHTPMGSAQK